MDKKKSSNFLNELEDKELQEFRANLPFDEKYFPKLFDFIDQKLSNSNCTNNYKFAEIFCKKNKLDFENLLKWLQDEDHPYHCDCEILNLEDAFQYLTPNKKIVIKKKDWSTRKLSSLKTDFGFEITKVESPWVLKEITKKNEVSYVFQIGNKEGYIGSFINSSEIDDFYNDSFIKEDFITTTEIENDLDFTVTRDIYKNFEFLSIKTIRWAPILLYFKPLKSNNYILKLQTELARQKNDIKEFYKILDHII
ncbi:DUF2695 domain-containing protein [Flavobacterium sp.]|uniref:DUF2695 domain-containing protein n=1 Tax=Flavobacterium sp. TaxID=239 RepID=UPI002639F481|nr:DUF2695 domain-containing protein [Flavobacterium sp.]